MAVLKIERTSRRDTRAQLGEVSRIVESFTLEADAVMTAQEVLDDTTPGLSVLTPHTRERHITSPQYVCVRVDASPLTPFAWRLEAEWTSMHDIAAHTAYSRMTRRGRIREMRCWRAPTVLPTDGDSPWFPVAAITTPAIDVMGEPELVRGWYHEISIDVWVDQAHMIGCASATDWELLWNSYLGVRNSVEWLGYPAGSVVFTGWSQSLTEDPWMTYSLQYSADHFYHLEQRVLPHVDGSVLLTASTTVGSPPQVIRQAGYAYWYQPYRTARLPFASMWNFGQIIAPTPAHPTPC